MVINFFTEYVDISRKNIYKYLKFIFKKDYDESVADEYVKTYIEARYYNLSYKENNRVFYLRVKESLIKTMKKLLKKNEDEKKRTENYINYKEKEKIICNMFTAFDYIFFFDKLRDTENMKRLDTIEKVIDKLYEKREKDYLIQERKNTKSEFTKLVKENMENSEKLLDKYFEDDTFKLEIKKLNEEKNIYEITLMPNVSEISMIYSSIAIDMAYNSEAIKEQRLLPEYTLLNLMVTRDIVEANFKDQYIVEFTASLFSKKQKIKPVLDIINDAALQDKINLKVTYEELKNYKSKIFDLMKQGYKFALELDNEFENIEEIKKLQMFSYIIVKSNLKIRKQIMQKYKKIDKIIYK